MERGAAPESHTPRARAFDLARGAIDTAKMELPRGATSASRGIRGVEWLRGCNVGCTWKGAVSPKPRGRLTHHLLHTAAHHLVRRRASRQWD
eukprot:scaffold329771_cov61-Tisochrysis_lutea.AAC.3